MQSSMTQIRVSVNRKEKKVQKRKALVSMLGLAALVFSVNTLAQQTPIKIGVIGPVTGKSSEAMGISIMGGAHVFLSDINQVGGILGRPVQLIERDDEAKPEVGLAMAKELIEKEKVSAIVGYANTGVALAAAKYIQDSKVPLIVTGATGAAVTKNFGPAAFPTSYIFRLAASDALQPVVILNDVIDRRKIEKIALIHDESPYGQLGKQSILDELTRRNIKPVDVESFKVGDADTLAQLQRARDAGAQAIVMYCLGPDAATIARSAEKLKLHLPMVGPWGMSQQTFIDKAGDSAEGARMAVTFIENELSPQSNEFSLAYRKINNTNRIPSAVAAAQTYDALRLLTLAMFQSNSSDPTQIRNALEDLKQRTNSTVVSRYFRPFSPTDHEAIALNMVILGEIHNGKVVYAYKEDANSGLIARVKKVENGGK
jgi:branched-chain amino acid transport system substrate-binding protein